MAWGTQEQKGDIAKMGIEALIGFTKSMADESKRINNEAKDNIKNVDAKEFTDVLEINAELNELINNLLTDAELGCKYKKTEEIFLYVIRIIMYDVEYDYREIIDNFTKAIDTQEFIDSHEVAESKRNIRLDKEYAEEMKTYEVEMFDYRRKISEHKSKNFFSKIFAEEPIEPLKPVRRE
jgi:hypothetical protein